MQEEIQAKYLWGVGAYKSNDQNQNQLQKHEVNEA